MSRFDSNMSMRSPMQSETEAVTASAHSVGRRSFSAKTVSTVIALVLAAMCAFALAGCMQKGDGAPGLDAAKLQVPTIGEAGKLRVGVNTANSPMAGISGDRTIGIDVDIAAAVAKELGLEVEIVDVGSNGATAIEDDEVDIVLGIDDESADSKLWLSKEYIQTGIVLFVKEGSKAEAPTPESEPLIAAQVSSKSAWAVTNIFGDDALDSTTDLASAFTALEDGDIDYVASDAIIGLYAANRQGIDVEICAILGNTSGYHAMADTANVDLQLAVQDALDAIEDNGVLDVIEKKWLGRVLDLKGITKIEVPEKQATNAEDDEESDAEDNEDAITENETDGDSVASAGIVDTNGILDDMDIDEDYTLDDSYDVE